MQTNELGSGTLLNIRTITFLWTTLNTAVKNKVKTLNTVSPTGSIRVQTKAVQLLNTAVKVVSKLGTIEI